MPIPAPELAKELKMRLLDHDILISLDGPHNNVLKIKPPMVISKREVDTVNNAIDLELRAMDY